MYKKARKACGLSIEEASSRVHVAHRTLCVYEAGERTPPPEVVLDMARTYGAPSLTQAYCRESCAIGRAYSYVVLDNVNLDPPSVALKLLGELSEAQAVLQRMLTALVNKNGRDDFTATEWEQFCRDLHEFLDVEHNIETLKISLGSWTDVSELVAQHNRKCVDRGYTTKKETA
jgi:transcriptional regulator with XRE-family HTH domain